MHSLKEDRWGEVICCVWQPGESREGDAMGPWDAELVAALPRSVRCVYSSGEGGEMGARLFEDRGETTCVANEPDSFLHLFFFFVNTNFIWIRAEGVFCSNPGVKYVKIKGNEGADITRIAEMLDADLRQ